MAESGENKGIKVTDKRMFTEDGELRDEYRHIGDSSTGARPEESKDAEGQTAKRAESDEADSVSTAAADASPRTAAAPAGQGEDSRAVGRADDAGAAGASGAASDDPRSPFEGQRATQVGIVDLMAMLAEPVAFFLGDAPLPDGSSGEDLPRARAHIDLLAVLKEKTQGNLSPEEASILSDLLYQLQMRYVSKAGG